MRQRLGVAQAILHQPSLLIFDELTNGLDPQGIYEFRSYLKRLTEQGIAVKVSSHLLAEMQQMCDRVAIIQDGDWQSRVQKVAIGSSQLKQNVTP